MIGQINLEHLEKVLNDIKSRGNICVRFESLDKTYYGPFGPFSPVYKIIANNGDEYTLYPQLDDRIQNDPVVRRLEKV